VPQPATRLCSLCTAVPCRDQRLRTSWRIHVDVRGSYRKQATMVRVHRTTASHRKGRDEAHLHGWPQTPCYIIMTEGKPPEPHEPRHPCAIAFQAAETQAQTPVATPSAVTARQHNHRTRSTACHFPSCCLLQTRPLQHSVQRICQKALWQRRGGMIAKLCRARHNQQELQPEHPRRLRLKETSKYMCAS
jgi:hypothetical protein